MTEQGLSYRDSGVDIDAGNALVKAIGPAVKATTRSGVVGAIGGFGGIFDPAAAGYRDPLLVAATDGVGTKLKIAVEAGRHETVGIDLVAMCVNDLVVQGAEPLFFLDYFATSLLDVEQASAVINGIAEGCRIAGCALIGGETAELPGFYAKGEYDLAGFAVGAVERDRLLPRTDVEPGDIVVALPSSGVHSNGFSLVRKIVEKSGLAWSDAAPFAQDKSLAEALLAPTRIYTKTLAGALKADVPVKALSHITGGGLTENIPRVLPDGIGVVLDLTAMPRPPVFDWLAATGPVATDEMLRTFNCGVGMIAILPPDGEAALRAVFEPNDEPYHVIGTVRAIGDGDPQVAVTGGPGA